VPTAHLPSPNWNPAKNTKLTKITANKPLKKYFAGLLFIDLLIFFSPLGEFFIPK
jgi:hypothetical protein